MEPLCNLCIIIPSDNMQVIEDLHVCVNHAIFTALRSRMLEAAAQDLVRQRA